MAQTEQGEMGEQRLKTSECKDFPVNGDKWKCGKTTCKKPNEGRSIGLVVYVDWLQPFNAATDP